MKKTTLLSFLFLICTLCLSLCLSACANIDGSITPHIHNYQWVDSGDGTHNQRCPILGCDAPNINAEPHVWGVNGVCEKCKVAKQNDEHTHNYSPKYDETNHWQECSVVGCDEKVKDFALHDTLGTNGVCSVCGYSNSLLTFKTFQIGENDTVYGKVSNSTETFSFIKEITVNSATTYTVSTDMIGNQTIPTKTVPLEIGDNTFYILAQNENNAVLFMVTIRRRPIYNVTYITNGGSPVLPQEIEEDSAVNEQTSAKTGYTFVNWTVNNLRAAFPYSITQDTEFNAVFTANDYTITLDANGGETATTIQILTYDNSYTLPVPAKRLGYVFTGWYYNEDKITDTDGESFSISKFTTEATFTAHWRRSCHQLDITYNAAAGSISGTGAGTFDYNTEICVTASENNLGYKWLGWYDGDTKLSEDKSYSFLFPDKNVDLIAKWKIASEMEPFIFNSSTDECSIISVKDTTITSANIPDYVTGIESYAFRGCSELRRIEIPQSIAQISGNAFYGCIKLNGVYITDIAAWCEINFYDTYNNSVFSYAHNLYLNDKLVKELVIPNCVTSISANAFRGCSSLISIIIPSSVTYIGYYAFSGCSNLTGVYITDLAAWCNISFGESGANPLICAHNLYLNNVLVTNLTIPNSVTAINNHVFIECSSLTSITIPNGVASIGRYAFSSCSNLTSIEIPNSVTEIGTYAFNGCSRLLSIEIPYGVTGIWNSTFRGCSSLTSITIPNSVTSIVEYAFADCANLRCIEIPESVAFISHHVFYGCSNIIAYCKAQSKPEEWDKNWSSGITEIIWGYEG